MAITSAICTSFKQQLLVGTHNFTNGANSFKLALYTSSATLGAGTTVYVTTGQASGTNYTAGGSALTNVTPFATGTTAVCDFNDLTFSTATITARGCTDYTTTRKVIKPLQPSTLVVIKPVPQETSRWFFQRRLQLAQSFDWRNAKWRFNS